MYMDIALGASAGKIIMEYEKSDGTILQEEGSGEYFMKVNKAGDKITVRGEKETETSAVGTIDTVKDATDTSLDDPGKARETPLTPKSKYTTEEEVKIKIEKYDNTILVTNIYGVVGGAKYSVGSEPLDEKEEKYNRATSTSLDYGLGYINVLLHYKSTYETDAPEAKVWANIDSTDTLTIVTKLTGVTGKVRLKFTAGDKTYYSNNTFNITDSEAGEAIYCRIKDTDKKWYNNEWKVTVLDVGNTDIGVGGKVEYYTISDTVEIDGESKKGMQELSEAINTGANTKKADGTSRKFYLIDDTDMKDISVDPIAKSCATGAKWFDGYFGSGIYKNDEVTPAYIDETTGEEVGVKTISNIKINVSNNEKYAFGLFGWVGKPATIENLKIDNIDVDLKDINTEKTDYKAGGLAGFSDNGSSINNITIENSRINGTAYAGGVVGETKKELNNCTVKDTTVLSKGKDSYGLGSIYIGGIAGKATELGSIKWAKIDNVKIGSGDITMTAESGSIFNKTSNNYYVGGVAGYTECEVIKPNIDSNVKVIGGKIQIEKTVGSGLKTDDKGATYTGGVIGYKNISQAVSEFKISCTVSGYDNVGGIIGFNAGGDINKVSFNGEITGGGENIGGIVGCNTGGNISNCINNLTIDSESAKNVGGIVGLNADNKIEYCYNKGNIKGAKNVGGIAGVTSGTNIDHCGNEGTITGNSNTMWGESLEEFEIKDLYLFYNITGTNSTGTGGIVGKIYHTTITCSYNKGMVTCNYNGGGIVGVNSNGVIAYCFNDAIINKNESGASIVRNRLGGICGIGGGVTILQCYNKGNINGETSFKNTPLGSPTGGIIGFLIDDGSFIEGASKELDFKYVKIDVKYLTVQSYHNTISFCYNTGKVQGHYKLAEDPSNDKIEEAFNKVCEVWDKFTSWITRGKEDASLITKMRYLSWYNGGIVGYIGISVDLDLDKSALSHTTFGGNYYLVENVDSKNAGNEVYISPEERKNQGKNTAEELKKSLYEYANKNTIPGRTDKMNPDQEVDIFINYYAENFPTNVGKNYYNTIAPLEETEKGYEGYGVLWWELENYAKLKVYICSSNMKIPDGQDVKMTINEKSVNISDSNLGRYINGEEYHNWIMMIPKGETQYILGGKTRSTEEAKLPPFTASNDEIIKLIEIGGIYDNLIVHAGSDATIKWSDIITTVKRADIRNFAGTKVIGSGEHDVYVKYNGQVHDSKTKYEFTKDRLSSYGDGRFGSVFMDGNTVLKKANVITEDPYKTYYTYWPTRFSKKETKVETGSEWIKAKSACVIKIPIEKIEGRRGTKGIVFSKTNSTIQKANAKLRVGIYVSDNFLERIGTRLLNDTLHVSVAFGNSGYKEVTKTITNSYKYRENNVDWLPVFTYEFSQTSEIPEDVTVKLQWDANVVGVYVAIDYVDVDVTYYTK